MAVYWVEIVEADGTRQGFTFKAESDIEVREHVRYRAPKNAKSISITPPDGRATTFTWGDL